MADGSVVGGVAAVSRNVRLCRITFTNDSQFDFAISILPLFLIPLLLSIFFFFLGGNFFSRFDSFGQGHDSSKCETDMTKSLEPNGAVS